MKLAIIKDCVVAGKRQVIGDTIEVSTEIARQLKAMGRAVDPVAEPEPVDRSIGLTTDDMPKKRGRPKKVDINEL
jgi:hypothetical protein